MTKKERKTEELNDFLVKCHFIKNEKGLYKNKNSWNETITADSRGNNLKIKCKTEQIYSELITKVSIPKLKIFLKQNGITI